MYTLNADLLAIKAELTNDPQTLGLTTLAADDEANANKLNARNVGDAGYVKALPVKKRFVATNTIFGDVDSLEAQSLTPAQRDWWDALLRLDHIDPFADAETVEGLQRLFGVGTASRTAIDSLMVENGSRIEQLFQAGTLSKSEQVTPSDVANARAAV